MKKPNLFIVGAPKCGTSALHYLLGQHPDIFMPIYKEPHFFSKDFHKESDAFHGFVKHYPFRTEHDYLSVFKGAKNEKIVGDASTHALFSKVAAEEIYKFNPKSKIIIMIREPSEYLYSLHSQLYKHLDEDIKDFEAALSKEEDRRRGKNIPKTVEFPSKLFYSDWVKFSDGINRYYNQFGKDNVMVIVFEEFRADNLKICREVFKFLGVDDSFIPEVKVVHANKELKHRGFMKFIKNPIVFKVMKIIPRKLYSAIGRKMHDLLYKQTKRDPMREEFRIELKKKYKEEVEKLSNLLDKDLVSFWGYDGI